MRVDHRLNTVLAAGVMSLACSATQAMEPVRLDVPAQPMTTAALQLAVQAGVAISAIDAAACGRSRSVRGVLDVETALGRMLTGSGCTFRRMGPKTYIIVARPVAQPAPPRVVAPEAPVLPIELDEIIVTATKQDLALATAPYALSVIDGAAVDAASRRDTAALATRLAGLTVTNLGPGRNKVFVRGLADSPLTGQTQAMVGLYLDDTRLTYDAPDPDLRLVDLERVELLRGPQGALYGAGSIGGVLKLVSRQPRLDAFEGEIDAGLTFGDDTAAGHSLDVVFNVPLLRDRLAARVVIYDEELEGVIDDPGLGLVNAGKTVRGGARAAVLWRINDDWEARLGAVFQNLEIGDSQYAFESYPPYERSLSTQEPSNNDFNGVSLAVTGDLGWGQLKLSSAYQGHELDRRYDATVASARFGASGGPLAYDEGDDIRAFAFEASVAAARGISWTWLAGLYVSHYTHDRTGNVLDLDPGILRYQAVKRDETQEAAVFGEFSWSPNDRLSVVFGGRYFNVEIQSVTQARQEDGISDDFGGRLTDDESSLKAVLEYAVSDRLLVYGQASQGYRVGGFNGGALLGQDYGEPGSRLQPYRRYRPDNLLSYEAGARWRGLDDRLALRMAAFSVDWRSIQSDRVSPDGLPFTANIGSGGNIGVEIEGVWTEGPWRIDFNLVGNDPALNAAEDSYPLVTDSDLPGVPKVLGAVGARYQGRFRDRPTWISGSVGYVGGSSQQLTPETTSEMGDYVTSEVSAGIGMGAWSATMRIDNPLGGAGDTFGYGNPFLVGRETVATPQAPRNVSLSLSRSF